MLGAVLGDGDTGVHMTERESTSKNLLSFGSRIVQNSFGLGFCCRQNLKNLEEGVIDTKAMSCLKCLRKCREIHVPQ